LGNSAYGMNGWKADIAETTIAGVSPRARASSRVVAFVRCAALLSTPSERRQAMVKPVKFAHVVYMTRRFDEMLAWYSNVFEAEVVYENPAFAFLTYDDEHHRFAIANLDLLKPDAQSRNDRGEIGVNHVAYTYRNVGDLLDTYARLKRAGITPYWPVHHQTTLSLYYADPDGNRMEFQVDCGTVAEATALMKTDGFAANPVGVMYDPDALLARFEAGETDEALLAVPPGPPSPIPAAHGMT
jgi:catechol 2,3-dioxygenase-like lactoylglutathione lyase family enzyme